MSIASVTVDSFQKRIFCVTFTVLQFLKAKISHGFYFCPYRTWLDMLYDVLRALPWAMEAIGLSARR